MSDTPECDNLARDHLDSNDIDAWRSLAYRWERVARSAPSATETKEALHDLAVCCYQYDSAKSASVSNYRDALQKAYNLAVPDLAKCPHGYRRKNCGLCATADGGAKP